MARVIKLAHHNRRLKLNWPDKIVSVCAVTNLLFKNFVKKVNATAAQQKIYEKKPHGCVSENDFLLVVCCLGVQHARRTFLASERFSGLFSACLRIGLWTALASDCLLLCFHIFELSKGPGE
ncbi:hypothetical protein JTB14_029371 [Gonioctena quinquepunctata]|nr:hypothetical protein JTB14_029371 [Gonioctena quinquepunctata]